MEIKVTIRAMCAVAVLAVNMLAGVKFATAGSPIEADVQPPPPRIERVAHRDGYIWAPGYWEWSAGGFRWTTGRYLFERRGFRWAPGRWEQNGPRWRLVPGCWIR